MALKKRRTFQREHYRHPIRYLCVMQRPSERITDSECLRHSGNRIIESLQPSLKFAGDVSNCISSTECMAMTTTVHRSTSNAA